MLLADPLWVSRLNASAATRWRLDVDERGLFELGVTAKPGRVVCNVPFRAHVMLQVDAETREVLGIELFGALDAEQQSLQPIGTARPQ